MRYPLTVGTLLWYLMSTIQFTVDGQMLDGLDAHAMEEPGTQHGETTCDDAKHQEHPITTTIKDPPSTAVSSKKVLVLVEPSPFTYVSGYANRFQNMALHLMQDFGDSVEFITAENVHPSPPSSFSWQTSSNETYTAPIYYTRGMVFPGYNLLTLATDWTWLIPRRLFRQRPDIVHVSSPGFLVWSAILWARLWQVPLVCSYHTHIPVYVESHYAEYPRIVQTILHKTLWGMIRLVAGWTDLVLVTSPQVQADFQQHGIQAHVWKKGIDTEVFHPKHYNPDTRKRMLMTMKTEESSTNQSTSSTIPTQHPPSPSNECLSETVESRKDKSVSNELVNDVHSAFLMVYVGRLSPEKRLMDLLPILKALPQAHLCFVGQGPLEAGLKQAFATTGDRTTFLGSLRGTELSQAFASADVFVMPSDSETLGFVVLESMASGVPVVAARTGGIPDLIQDRVDGFLVTPGDINEYVDRLRKLQDDVSLRRAMGVAARQEMQQYSWKTASEDLRVVQYTAAIESFHQRWEQRLWRLFYGQKDDVKWTGVSV